MSSGSVRAFGAESKLIVGAFWAMTVVARAAAPHSARAEFMNVFMERAPSASRRARRRRMQNVLLHAPRLDFAEDQLVRVAAVDLVDHLEPGRDLPGLAELADHGAVHFRLVDFARVLPRFWRITVRIRVGEEDVLMRSRRDAQRPSGAEGGDLPDRLQIVVELLVAVVGPVGHPD